MSRPVLLPAAARVPKPWKNGGGVTTEIAVSPDGAGLDDFEWRLSAAEVASDGPFSTFPGIDRIIGILSGDGLILTVEGIGTVRLDRSSDPFAFPGDAPTVGRLAGGPVTDLNLMVRRGHAARLERIDLASGTQLTSGPGLLLWQTGGGTVTVEDRVERLGPMDALLLPDRVTFRADPDTPGFLWLATVA
ncbi:HutD family protein [Prosthecomicrobium hirschii]|uniref:HutD/Ves family protein n=1 Tax=Prosthecodimorpha hirschii TaxID=665126 RepID=UPI00221F53AD|nr:HutD family protein [Prosthecomicrobium hirschii]